MNIDTWKPGARLGVVALGYFLAAVLASIATAIRIGLTSGPAADAMSGMYAFGDSMVWVGVFGVASLAPTALGLYLVRRSRGFWIGLAVLGVLVAVTGTGSVLCSIAGRTADPKSVLGTLAMLSPLRILLALPITLSLVVCAWIAPFLVARRTLLVAVIAELCTGAYSLVAWFLPAMLNRGH